jgi:hypothetical protein
VAREVGPALPAAAAQIQARLGLGTGFFFLIIFLFDLPRRVFLHVSVKND